MLAIGNAFLCSNAHGSFTRLANVTRLHFVSFVALGTLAALMFSLSAWANIKVASMYGTGAILQHSFYTIFLPLSITIGAVRIAASIILLFHEQEVVHHSLREDEGLFRSRDSNDTHLFYILSPLPGKCHLKHNLGDIIQQGDVICAVECMKMTNSILAEKSGKITEIFTQDGTSVTQDQPILRCESSSK